MSAKIIKILDDLGEISLETEKVKQTIKHIENKAWQVYQGVGEMLREMEK